MRLTKRTHYVFEKRGWFYFSRRVPSDLSRHYRTGRIVMALRTRSRRSAETRAASLAAKLEQDWLTLRWNHQDDPLRRFMRAPDANPEVPSSDAPLLSEARDLYIRLKGPTRSKTFTQAAERAVLYLTETIGDLPLDAYTRPQVNQFRDAMFARGLSRPSVARLVNTLRAIVNFVAKEQGLDEVRTFSGVYLGEEDTLSDLKRQPIPLEIIRSVQAECVALDDEARWLVALVSDSGMRLAEAAGLVKEDIVLDSPHPHIRLREHKWRRLKTRGSERLVPLVGASLWATKRAVESTSTAFLFPKYCSPAGCNANSASGGLNKWLKPRVPERCVVHSFRHSFRDRMRAVECPRDIIDRLGGWTVGGVSEGYGEGYPLDVLTKWMQKIETEPGFAQYKKA